MTFFLQGLLSEVMWILETMTSLARSFPHKALIGLHSVFIECLPASELIYVHGCREEAALLPRLTSNWFLIVNLIY